MGWRLIRDVLELSETYGHARLVLLVIAFHADDGGDAFPGIERLSKLTKLNRRSVIRRLKEIERLNELTIVRTKYQVNKYRITLSRCRSSNQVTPQALQGDTIGRDQVTRLSPESSEEIMKEIDHSPKVTNREDSESPTLFDQFFEAMPSRAGGFKQYKEKARQLFERLSTNEQLSCTRAAKEYKKVCRNTNLYPKDPYRFLEGGRAALWLDYLPKDQPVTSVRPAPPRDDVSPAPQGTEVDKDLDKFCKHWGLRNLEQEFRANPKE